MNKPIQYIRRNLKYIWPSNYKTGAIALYRRFFRSGVFLSKSELGMCSLLPVKKLDKIVDLVKPKTVLDVGCGTGKATEHLHRRGLDVLGVEASTVAIRKSQRPDLIYRHDLRVKMDLKRYFDLVWCFEVAEHIHPKYTDVFVDTLVRHSNVIALSAAPPGQGGEGHFNEQPKSYWIKKFSNRGYELHEDWTAAIQETKEFYSENMMVFTRASSP